jgi:carbon storage regulator
MLVLSRHQSEEIVISSPFLTEPIVISVVGVAGGNVRLGIEAAKEITVDRREVHERKQRASGHWPDDRAA